jgi:septum formation protein
MTHLDPTPVVLASASPRRRRLFAWLGMPYTVTSTDTPEDLESPLAGVPPILARSIAAEKAVAARSESGDDATIVACDTIVLLDRKILGKPADLDEAFEMLRALSGRTHDVITGVALILPGGGDPRTFAVTTPVHMNALTADDMQAWADEGELLGCAGAYNIERHMAAVDATECYQNVAGLPLCHVYHRLRQAGFTGMTSPVEACDESRCVRCELGPGIAGAPVRPASA